MAEIGIQEKKGPSPWVWLVGLLVLALVVGEAELEHRRREDDHGLGLAQYDPPVISRIWSLDYPVEIQPGMTFALETQHGKLHDHGVRLEEMLYVTDTGIEMVTTYKCHEIIATT